MIITFLGTKGGTGTTTMAVNCAAEMQRVSQQATLVIDAKQSPGDVAVFLGLHPRYSFVELLDQVGWSNRALASRFVTEHASGLHVLAASDAFGRPNSRDADGVEQTFRCMATFYPYVVIDAGSTLTSSAVIALNASDVVMLVANPDVPCLRNLQRLSDALRVAGVPTERVRVLLNRASDKGVVAVAQLEKVVGRTIDYQVSSDYRTVVAALNAGVPVSAVRPSEVQQQLEALARTLIEPRRAAAAS